MNKADTKIFIIDDDIEILDSLKMLLKSVGFQVECFTGIDEFTSTVNYRGTGCILIDVFLNGKNGLEHQEMLEKTYSNLPLIYMSGHGNIPMSVEVMKKGALNFLEKPIDEKNLFRSIDEALNKSQTAISEQAELFKIKPLFKSLTPRELDVFRCVITGMLNKEIATYLKIAEHTVKNHRLKISQKLQAKSVVEMINIAEKLQVKAAKQ